LVILLFTMGTICYADRTNIGIVVNEVLSEENPTDTDVSEVKAGWVLSAFYYGYILTQLPGEHPHHEELTISSLLLPPCPLCAFSRNVSSLF
jgi:hypothetical protein